MINPYPPFVMREDLYACDGALILRQGEIITPSVLQEIMKKGASRNKEETLLKEKELFEDIMTVMNEENYKIVFEREEDKNSVMDVVGEIPLTEDICREMEVFKVMDHYTYRHVLVTTALTTRLYKDLCQDPQEVLLAAATALTHDFGKSRIPIEVLQSSRKLNYEEFLYILEHPWIGFLLLTYYTGRNDSLFAQVAFNHHEKIDGSGYPRGVKVDNSFIQVVTICDMFDALISPRTYRMIPFNIRGALDYLCDEAESGRLNMTAVRMLLAYNRRSKPALGSLVCSKDHSGYAPPEEKNNYSCHEDYQEPDLDDKLGTGK